MTREDREDAIDIIQSILDKYEEDECLVTEITIGDEDIKAFKMAIKALEQETFINKPCCISGEVCEHDKNVVLDKLRAEIAEYGSIWVEYKITGRRDKDIEQLVSDVLSQAKKQVLEVIDKYRGESEEQA